MSSSNLIKYSPESLDLETILINIRSDTQTLPTDDMRRAIYEAELGDDTYDECPTVHRFEKLAAEMTGMEAALLVISGNMGNLTALMTHAHHGDEVIIDLDSHIYYYEEGGLANIAGLMPMPVKSHQGMLNPDEVRSVIRKPNLHYPIPRLICLENTHNRSGGRVVPVDLHEELCKVAREADLSIHLDGARIFNASLAAKVPVKEYTRHVDSMMFCLSKGLGAPLGSVLVGSRDFIEKADFHRKRLGGGMRQAGLIAAAGIIALEDMVDRLEEDHTHAKHLAQAINAIPGLAVELETVETNMVYIDHSGTGLDTGQILNRLKQWGLIASGRPPYHVRMVTNLHHNSDIIDEVIRRMKLAFEP
tara:strand:- start:110 stop:1195 length:1086 start_codon:yes stop_codon:yes gene_type:complete